MKRLIAYEVGGFSDKAYQALCNKYGSPIYFDWHAEGYCHIAEHAIVTKEDLKAMYDDRYEQSYMLDDEDIMSYNGWVYDVLQSGDIEEITPDWIDFYIEDNSMEEFKEQFPTAAKVIE